MSWWEFRGFWGILQRSLSAASSPCPDLNLIHYISKRSSENFSDDLLLYSSHRLMQMLVNGLRQCFADAFDLFQIFFAGGNDAAQAAEAGEQGLAAFAAYAGDVAEG